ncbi:hypothetical protein CsSME_00003542 [Camellia sinensis var. sinensis]
MIQFTRGLDANYFLGEGDYVTFIETHLIPPLTGIRGGEGMRAPAMRERLPTALTCWRYTGEVCQIPIEPAAAGHRYVSAPDAPPGYIEDLLELLTSFEGIILRREALLGFHGIQVLPIPTAPAAVAPGPSVSLPAARRERQAPARSRGRARSARAESGPSKPILSKDDTVTSEAEEATSQHAESSQSGDDNADSGSASGDATEPSSEIESSDDFGFGSASGSNSGADGDSFESSPRKRTKRASRN